MLKNKKKLYKAAHGSPFTNEDAQRIGDELSLLKDVLGDEIKPQDVLDYSKDPDSALYSYFDWDDKSAANKWRKRQAGEMIRNVYVIIETVDGPKETRALVSITSEITDDKRYVSIGKAMKNENYRKQVIAEAMKRAQTWRNNYGHYKELAKIVRAIDNWNE